MVQSTYSSFPHSKNCRQLISATSRMSISSDIIHQKKIVRKILGNAENRTRGCSVRSANATSVLCHPPLVIFLYRDCLEAMLLLDLNVCLITSSRNGTLLLFLFFLVKGLILENGFCARFCVLDYRIWNALPNLDAKFSSISLSVMLKAFENNWVSLMFSNELQN